MAKQQEETIVDIDQAYSKTETFLNENKSKLSIIGTILIVLVGGYLSYTQLYLAPMQQEAAEMMWKAEYYFENDSLDKAINGDGNYLGFDYIASEYSGTKAGNLAKYYLGVCYMQKGEFELAIQYLKDANLEDEIVGATALGTTGDAFVELENYNEALNYFTKAINHSDNNFSAPLYLMKKGLLQEKLGEYNNALSTYKEISDKYPNSAEGREVNKYIARAEAYAKS